MLPKYISISNLNKRHGKSQTNYYARQRIIYLINSKPLNLALIFHCFHGFGDRLVTK